MGSQGIESTITESNGVPSQNSVNNLLPRDVIGNKTDNVSGNSIYSTEKSLNEHAHSPAKVYPTLANGVLITGAAGAWALGAFAVIIPTSTVTSIFDIHRIEVEAFSANDVYEIVLYSGADGAEVEVGRSRFTRLSNAGSSSPAYFQTALIAANSQIKAKISSAAGGSHTATISLGYHTYY